MIVILLVALLPPSALGGTLTEAVRKCRQARDAYDKGQVQEAIKLYTEAIEINPQYAEAYYQRAQLYKELKHWDKRMADINSTLAMNPKHLGALRDRAGDFFYKGKYLDAELDYSTAIKADRHNWKDYYMRGRCRAAQQHDETAMKDFNRAIEEWQKAYSAYYERGKLYRRLGRDKRAEKDFNSTIEYYWKHAGAHVELGKLRLEEKKYDEALKLFTTADRLGGGSDGAPLYWRGNTYKALKDYARAAEDYSASIGRKFDTPQLRYNRAAAYYELAELEKARDDLRLAVKGDEKNKQYAWALRRVEQLLAKRQAAEEAKKKAEEEARQRAAEEARQRAAEEARQRAAEEAVIRAPASLLSF
jgi:tetratricopeptide (TPR) repeat protein